MSSSAVEPLAELTKDLLALIKSVFDREANIYVARLAGDDFDMGQVENLIATIAEGTAVGINEATQRAIDDVGVEKAMARTDQRADVAGTSIGTRMTGLARKEAGRQAPRPSTRRKVWHANTDRHSSLEGASVGLEDDWGGIEPGTEPNCDCSLEVI